METIEERYSLCSHCLASTTRYCHSDCHHYSKYLGATEQKAIDNKECETMVGTAVREARGVFIDKACEWIRGLYPPIDGCDYTKIAEGMVEKFRKAMEDNLPTSANHCTLTWQDVMNIVSIYGYTPRLDDNGNVRRQEDFFTEVLNRFNNQNTNK